MADSFISRRVIERVAENRIHEAQRAGAFDGLPGAGRPIDDLDEAYDPLWWVRTWLKRERLTEQAGALSPKEAEITRALVRHSVQSSLIDGRDR